MDPNNAAKGTPFLVLTDLDKTGCPPVLINEWLSDPKHPNLLFRVAVREVEAWILAHREAFAKFVGIRKESIPQDLDTMTRRCLWDTLKPPISKHNPTQETLNRLLKPFGLRLSVTTIEAKTRKSAA